MCVRMPICSSSSITKLASAEFVTGSAVLKGFELQSITIHAVPVAGTPPLSTKKSEAGEKAEWFASAELVFTKEGLSVFRLT
jgi:hypothetical protein